uniref:L-aminoadipate-semialdehyde dehydrogenase-phosphopantetheinyl transferase n=2 Tax=Ditylenchus dipsaci TaxID=166011 RepID=A0A915D9N5_9BILA
MAFSLQRAFENEHLEQFFRKAIQSISAEDYQKVICFRHKDDSLACLAGRLFLRQAAKKFTGAQWHEIEFERTERGKPYLTKPEGYSFGLNVSHQGDYTVFSSSCGEKVGVDVMRLDMARGNKTADEYITSMAKSASAEELRNMRGQATEQMKMTVFYRYWCLKEAILKATGHGIVNDLSRYDFRINRDERYRPGAFLTSTTHAIAVCRQKQLPKSCQFREDPETKKFFSQVDFNFLLDGATVLNPLPNDAAEEFNNFSQKPRKPFNVLRYFEIAPLIDLKERFPMAEFNYCLFHQSQAVFSSLRKKGLLPLYNNADVKMLLRCLSALAFLPVNEVTLGFGGVVAALEEKIQDGSVDRNKIEDLRAHLQYFENTYVGRVDENDFLTDALFPVSGWNVFSSVLNKAPRTNNAMEGWHRLFNKKFSKRNLNLSHFIVRLKEEEKLRGS